MLRLVFFQAGNAARRTDPQLAGFYHRLMTQQGQCHTLNRPGNAGGC